MAKTVQQLEKILALASTRRYAEMTSLFARPENHVFCQKAMERLEELGDQSLAARLPNDALDRYAAALSCGMVLLCIPGLVGDNSSFSSTLARLNTKVADVREELESERNADAKGPSSWDAGTDRFIELALAERFVEADNLMGLLDERPDKNPAALVECGLRIESVCDGILPELKDKIVWFYERAL